MRYIVQPPANDQRRVAPTSALVPASPDEFWRDPVGRFVRGPTYLVWVASPTLCGAAYFGLPTEEHVRALLPLVALDTHPAMKGPIDVLTDARHVRGLDDAAFRLLLGHVRDRLPAFRRTIRRQAIVHPSTTGLVGVVITGMYAALGARFATSHFVTPADGLRWLGYRADQDLVHTLDRLTAEALADKLGQLRDFLMRRPGTARLTEVALSLRVSERALQRALEAAGTSFREEIDRARVTRAAEWLVTTPDKLDTIARRLGVARETMTRVFTRLMGESPSDFRALRRPDV